MGSNVSEASKVPPMAATMGGVTSTELPVKHETPIKTEQLGSNQQAEAGPKREHKRIKISLRTASSKVTDGTFAWQLCGRDAIERRVVVKERAVAKALKHISDLRGILDSNLTQEDKSITQALREWVGLAGDIEPRHREFQLRVGVTGGTGAGKTSLLNALLETPELLARGHEQAATAVACSIAYNYDDTPGRESQAHVFFRKEKDVLADIIQTLQAINRAWREKNSVTKDTENHEDKIEAIAEAEAEKAEGIERIKAVWPDQDEPSLDADAQQCNTETDYQVTGQRILGSNPAVLNLLRQETLKIYSTDTEQLAKRIRPYLDSTQALHGGYVLFSAWPLLTKVDVYVRAPILRSGIVIIDLPGTEDNVDSRARVQRDYRDSLDVTLIVADVIRAADQKNVRQLLNSQQDAQMRVNRCLFSVILSKTESIDYKGYIKRSPFAAGNEQLEVHNSACLNAEILIRGFERQRNKIQRQGDRLQKRISKIQQKLALPGANETKIRSSETKTRESLEGLLVQLPQFAVQIADQQRIKRRSEAVLAHWAVSTRNRVVQERLREGFAKRREHLYHRASSTEQNVQHLDDHELTVMPTSAFAFWQISQDNEPYIGMPTVEYTGIPYVRQWLHRVTASRREGDLDITLGLCQARLEAMALWQNNPAPQLNLSVSPGHLRKTLAAVHKTNAKGLNGIVGELQKRIVELDPFTNIELFRAQFIQKAEHLVARWSLQYPDDLRSAEKLHASRYRAIVRRQGKPYTPQRNRELTYHWPASLANLVFDEVVPHYDDFISTKMPHLQEVVADQAVEQIWTAYITELENTITAADGSMRMFFGRTIAGLQIPKSTFQKEAQEVLSSFKDKGLRVYDMVVMVFEQELQQVFEEARGLSGQGCCKKNQELFQAHIKKNGKDLYNKAWNVIQYAHEKRKKGNCAKLREIAATALRSVENQVAMGLDTILGEVDTGLGKDAQSQMHKILTEWRDEWRFPKDVELDESGQKHFMLRDLRIPDELSEEHLQLMESGEAEKTEKESDDETMDSLSD